MEPTENNFLALAFGVPFGGFAVIFFLISVANRRVNWFLLKNVVGIDWEDNSKKKDEDKKKDKKKEIVKSYLSIQVDDGDVDGVPPLFCIVRFCSDLLASIILAIFLSIIFDTLIMSNQTLKWGDPCPAWDAYCFVNVPNAGNNRFNCSKGLPTNFSSYSPTIWCVGWVYPSVGVNDVLNTLGICGGLLGIVASIVPFTYYLSRYRNRFYLSVLCGIVPLIPIGMLGFIIWYTQPQAPSQIAIIVMALVILMVSIGWVWACWRSHPSNNNTSTNGK